MIPIEPVLFFSAFIAGLLMFLAPCTLPLLPAYLGFISGVTERELREKEKRAGLRRKVLKNSIFFVLGFSFVVIFTGITAGMLGSFVPHYFGRALEILGGILIMVFGLVLMGVLKPALLTKERKISLPKWVGVGNPRSSFLLGMAFSLGWTPCLGPIYGTILIFASSTETILVGALLLTIFSLGFSLPLLLFAVLIGQATYLVEKISPYLRTISVLGGIGLLAIGLSLLLGDTLITNWFYSLFSILDFEEVLMPYL